MGDEDGPEVAPVLEVSGEKGGTKSSVGERAPRDGVLASPSEPVQPIDGGLVEVAISILSRTAVRVPRRQPLRLLCRYSACCADCTPLRMAASAARRSGFKRLLLEMRGRNST